MEVEGVCSAFLEPESLSCIRSLANAPGFSRENFPTFRQTPVRSYSPLARARTCCFHIAIIDGVTAC